MWGLTAKLALTAGAAVAASVGAPAGIAARGGILVLGYGALIASTFFMGPVGLAALLAAQHLR